MGCSGDHAAMPLLRGVPLMPYFCTQNAKTGWAQGHQSAKSKRTVGAKMGERSGKVPDGTIRQIRALREYHRWTYKALAARYGLSVRQVSDIVLGVTGAFLVHSVQDLPE